MDFKNKLKIGFSTLSVVAFMSVGVNSLQAQSSCDTEEDPGQTKGKCKIVSGPLGDIASCSSIYKSGDECWFGVPDGGEQ